MIRVVPGEIPIPELHQYLLGGVAPRPIALASTVDEEGNPNLSPFSFFNVFGYNPTTLIFSPSRRGRDNTTKHTFENAKVVREVVINAVTIDMVFQANLASTDYLQGVDEFVKAGLTKLPSETVRPFRVKESPVQLECRVRDVIETASVGGAANLIVCEVNLMHVSENILGEDGKIDPQKIRLVGRLGKNYYTKAFGDAIFEVEKPLHTPGIGIDGLPEKIRFSHLLSGNDLGRLGNVLNLPDIKEVGQVRESAEIKNIMKSAGDHSVELVNLAKEYLEKKETYHALKILMLM